MSDDQPCVLVERSGSLGRLVLNRPDVRNSLDRRTAEEVLSGLRRHLADEAVRSIVITGAGDAFCAGGDLAQMRDFEAMTPDEAFDWQEPIVEAHRLMLQANKPVIAGVNGAAHAGGMGLAAMCDLIIAVRSATFCLPEVRVGLFPIIIAAHLVRALPRKVLLELMLTGEPLSAENCYRFGFVNHLADDRGELDEIVAMHARRFEKVSPTSVRLGRQAFTLLSDLPATQALDAAQFLNLPFFLGEDLSEGARAFLEKRQPAWSEDSREVQS
jgi:enoyl-CoA hydratase/carnithine racemase